MSNTNSGLAVDFTTFGADGQGAGELTDLDRSNLIIRGIEYLRGDFKRVCAGVGALGNVAGLPLVGPLGAVAYEARHGDIYREDGLVPESQLREEAGELLDVSDAWMADFGRGFDGKSAPAHGETAAFEMGREIAAAVRP